MDIKINYYKLLGVNHNFTLKELKKQYFKLSKSNHPDVVGGDKEGYITIKIAYETLKDENLRKTYDTLSEYGKDYDEIDAFFKIDYSIMNNFKQKTNHAKEVLNKEGLNIKVEVDIDNFNGEVSYERWLRCKKCNGTGTESSNDDINSFLSGDVECIYCDGTGKNDEGDVCVVCMGQGEIGLDKCKNCKGERRILGRQVVSNIEFEPDSDVSIVKFMGNTSKFSTSGKVGDLYVVKIKKED